jgi:CubicO group peptidase (beta-lactamase class C family)
VQVTVYPSIVTLTSPQLADVAAICGPFLRLGAVYDRVPGVSFGLAHRGDTVLLGAHGYADVRSGTPVDPAATAFRCASITKSLTATVTMQAVERGKLRLDDTVVSWLPWTRGALDSHLTVRELLMHAGSIIRDGSNAWDGSTMPDRAKLRAEVLEHAAFGEPLERFRYSNVAYSLLGEILQSATGKTFESLARTNVIRRLDLETSWPDLVPAARRALATGYGAARPNEERTAVAHVEARAVAPAGGLISTVPDLLEYQLAHLPGDDRLLTERSKREMQRTQWQRDSEPHYGLGWMNWHIDGIAVVGHSGGFPGFITKIAFAPSEGLAAAVLTNAASPFAAKGIETIYATVANVRRRWAESAASTKWHTRGSLAPFVGLYRNRGNDVLVSRINGSLYILSPEEPTSFDVADRLEPRSRRRFVIAAGYDFGNLGEEVTFNIDRDGKVNSLSHGANVLTREDLP